MDEPTRRAWSRPELIVLVRSGPEEAVLAACKQVGSGHTAHGLIFGNCGYLICTEGCHDLGES